MLNKKLLLMILAAPLLFVLLTAEECGEGGVAGQQQKEEQNITGTYQERLTNAVPYPLEQMTDSTERRNLRERLLRFNDANKVGYVYLFSDFGTLINYYTIKGKVSSTNSQMTTTQIVRDAPHSGSAVVDAPGDDGSYGPNETGVFFFTTEGVLVTWNGLYLYSDYPLSVTTTPIIEYDPTNAAPSNDAPDQ